MNFELKKELVVAVRKARDLISTLSAYDGGVIPKSDAVDAFGFLYEFVETFEPLLAQEFKISIDIVTNPHRGIVELDDYCYIYVPMVEREALIGGAKDITDPAWRIKVSKLVAVK